MESIEFYLLYENNLPLSLKPKITALEYFCFSHIDLKELEECFYSEIIARVCAFFQKELIGHLVLHKRKIIFDGKPILIGGAVGACIKEEMRRKGIARRMMEIGLNYLKKENCDVVCLTADLEQGQEAINLYETLGYVRMNRKISFEDSKGNLRYDSGSMFIPLCSVDLFDHVMESSLIFHYGKGYW